MPPAQSGGGNGAKILIAVAVVAVLGIGAFLVLGGGSSNSGPEQAVRDFVDAAVDKDCGRVIDLMADSNFAGTTREEAAQQCKDAMENGEDGLFEVGAGDELNSVEEKSNDGDVAVVTVKSTSDGEESTEDITLRKESGKWRIDFVATADVGGDIPDDGGDLPDGSDDEGGFDTDTTLPDLEDLPELPDIPECDYESSDYDPVACAEAMTEGG